MDLNKNQKGNLIIFVVLILILVGFGFLHTICWSDSYIVTIISGLIGVFLGIILSFILDDLANSDWTMGNYVELLLSGLIVLAVFVVAGTGFLGSVIEAKLVDPDAVGDGAYSGTVIISAMTGLFGFDFNQLESSN